MIPARTRRWLRCAPWRLGRPATLSGGGGGGGSLLPARAKRGAATSAPSGAEQAADQGAAAPQGSAEDAPAVPDLSRHAPAGERWQPAALPQLWLAFSDLHVSHKTRATTLAVLDRVHEEAARRGAGILFLGDFWHTRGTLPVEPLNEVVQQLAAWRQPTLMLPGNHDQVSLGGEVHALTPLAAANPAIHAFDGPALFLDALWLPYRRDPAALEAALAAASDGAAPLRAVFAHADIVGAMMNEAYQAHDGLPPELFPPSIPTYTGHYHKPHTVAGTRITYIGSPYQVTRAEAGQRKRLLLLDRAAGWEMADQLPLDIGPRYFVAAAARVADSAGAPASAGAAADAVAAVDGEAAAAEVAVAEAAAAAEAEGAAVVEPAFELQLPEGLRRGDRLLLTLPAAAAKQHAKQLRRLEKQGIEVEVFTPPEAAAAPRIAAAEGMGPLQLWSEYCAWQRLPPPAAEAGAGLLASLLRGAAGGTALEQPHAAIEFEAVEVEGYFSFRDPVRYELGSRGLVVVTGQVHDTAEAGVESNGAGKTALMMAPLWAFTGSVDSRAEGAGTARPVLADIIYDGAKRARVRVEGKVNGAPFWVERTANKKASSVAFHLNGEDLTTQENRLTQARIDEALGADLLGRVVFYGQSDITALLEASDRAFKQELAKLVDMRIWEAAKEASRRELSARRDGLRDAAATLRERQQQAGELREQLQGLQAAAAEWEQQAAAAAAGLRQEAGLLLGRVHLQQAAAAAAAAAGQQQAAQLESEAAQLSERLESLEAQLASEQRGAAELAAAEQQLAEQQAQQRSLQEQQQQWSQRLGAASAAAEEASRQQAAAREEAAAAGAALEAFLQQHPHLVAGAGSDSGSSTISGISSTSMDIAAELDELLRRQQLLSREVQESERELTGAREAAAAQRSRLQAKQEAAQRAQREAQAAAAAEQRQRAAVQVSGAAEALSLVEVKKQQRSMQRRLAAAQNRLGAAQGQAREREQQLEEYRALVEGGSSNNGSNISSSGGGGAAEQNGVGQSGGGSSGAGVAVLEQQQEQQEHEHGGGAAVCDRCAQPISPELFRHNVERLQAAAATAAAKAAKEEQKIAELEQAAAKLEKAAAAAEQAAQQLAALQAAEDAAAARAAEAEAASAEAGHAAVAAQESEGLVADRQLAVDDLHASAAQLAAAISAAEAAAALEQQRQELLWAAGDAAQAEAAAAQRRQQAEQQQAEAAESLEGLQAATAEAAASAAALQQLVQQLGRGQQEAELLRSQQQAARQQLRLQQQQLDALADLGRQLETVAQDLSQLSGSSSSAGAFTDIAAAGSQASSSAEDLEAAAAAARSMLAAAADLQQRWQLHQQQSNLPARDAALVQQQLVAAEVAITEVERRHAELEGEVGVWKQVDDALLPRGVPNFVVEGVLGDLQAAASRNLSALTSGMSLTLNPCKPAGKRKDAPEGGTIEQIEKIVHVRQPGSLEMRQRSVRQLSGGERRRVALALALGFSELAAQRGRLRSNLVVLDEVMQHLDGEGCLRVAQLLKQLPYSSVLVVAQAHSLQTQVFDATDVVVKSGGCSTVEQGSSAAVS